MNTVSFREQAANLWFRLIVFTCLFVLSTGQIEIVRAEEPEKRGADTLANAASAVSVLTGDNNYFLKIDLQNPGVSVRVGLAHNDSGGLQSLSGMAARYRDKGYLDWAIINGDLFSANCGSGVNCGQGLTYIDGNRRDNWSVYGTTWPVRGNIGFDSSNGVQIAIGDAQPRRHMTIAGGPVIVKDGGNPVCSGQYINGKTHFSTGEQFDGNVTSWCTDDRPITMIGYGSDRRYLYMGMSRGENNVIEVAQWLRAQGAHEILRFDSGSSSGMYHSGSFIGGSSLKLIANHFAVIVRDVPPDGINLCDGTNYGQPCQAFTYVSNDHCTNLQTAGWDNRADSMKFVGSYVGQYHIVLYDDNGCNTYNAQYDADIGDLGSFKNSIGSMRIEKRIFKPDLSPEPRPGRSAPVVISSASGTSTNDTLYAGQPVFIDWGYKNGGTTNAPGHRIKLTINGETVMERSFDGLNTGATEGADDLQITWPTVGTFTVSLTVDSNTTVDEINEGNNVWSGDFTWVAAPPPVFNKEAPVDGAEERPLDLTLNWSSSSGANRYEYCLNKTQNTNCDTEWQDVGNATHVDLSNLDPDTTYSWQVRASNSGGVTHANNNTWWSFRTKSSGPSVSTGLSPAVLQVGASALVTVSLNHVPAEGYSSAEFTCPYTESLLNAGDIKVGSLFGEDAVAAINGPQGGSFIVAIAGSKGQKATTSGAVFTFKVTALQAGQTSLECTARVSKGDGNILTLPSTGPASLTIGGTITPTDTSTPTASSTPTLTPTPTDTPTPTASQTSTSTDTPAPPSTETGSPTPSFTPLPPENGTLTGQVIATEPVIIRLYDAANNLVASTAADPAGLFRLTAPDGMYTVLATASGFLSAQGSVTITSGNPVTLPVIHLLPGDIDNNNVIDQFDALTIGMNYNTITPTAADLNNDRIINILDLELLAANYRTTGPIAWQ
jgi:hypothetical protein